MGDRREGECGRAEPINIFWAWLCPFNFRKPVPKAEKFEGKWFDRYTAGPEGPDALVLKLLEANREKNAESYSEFPVDNVGVAKMTWRHRLPRAEAWPVFSDMRPPEFAVAYDTMKEMKYYHDQYQHCAGSLGDDHPTCRKAEWYWMRSRNPMMGSFYEEMGELGHWDTMRKWGVKPRASFLPRYQPVKKNIPGMYEFFRSEQYLEKFDPEGEGEWTYPVQYVE